MKIKGYHDVREHHHYILHMNNLNYVFENIIATLMMMILKIDEEGLFGKKKVNTGGKSVFERALSLPATNWHCCISRWVGSI